MSLFRSEEPGPGEEGLMCSRNLAWGLISAELSAGCPETDSPFHSRADFSSTTSQQPPSFRACSPALEQLRSQEGEARIWPPGYLEDQLPWFLYSLTADHNPQTGKWFLLNGPKRPKNFCPVRQKRELVSSRRPQVLLGWFVRDDHHPTRISPQNVLSLSSPLL